MKVRCEKCGEQFAVVDNAALRGRMVKIRCRGCKEVLSVWPEAPTAPVADADADAGPPVASTPRAPRIEGSALIEIRQLADRMLSARPGYGREPSTRFAVEALLGMARFTPAVGTPLPAAARPRTPAWVVLLLAGGLAIVGGTAAFAVLLWRYTLPVPSIPAGSAQLAAVTTLAPGSSTVAMPVSPSAVAKPAASPTGAANPAAAQPVLPAGAVANAAATPPGQATRQEPQTTDGAGAPNPGPTTRQRHRGTASRGKQRHHLVASRGTVLPTRASRARQLDDEDLLGLLESTRAAAAPRAASRPAAPPAASSPSLPDHPDGAEVTSRLRQAQSGARACFERYHVPGTATVRVVIGGSGQVSSARVTGPLAQTPTGDCVERAVRETRFQAFRGSPYSVTCAYVLH